jgi:HD superfamily phosphodiesterase
MEAVENLYDKIRGKAKPYLDTRHNEVHVSLSYSFARKLLGHYPEADEEVVLAAILLHDVGWKMVPEEKLLDAFGPKVKNRDAQRFHEVEGARIAEKILRSLNCNEGKTRQIVAIIDGHDTREEALSLDDRLVKDADKLWRYTPIGVNIDHDRFGIDRDVYMGYLETMIERWFFTPEAKQMAGEALAESKGE